MRWIALLAALSASTAWAQDAPIPRPAIVPLILQTQIPRAEDAARADETARADSGDGPVMTLDDAVGLALAQNRQVKNSNLAVGMAADQIAQTRAQMFPQFQLKVTPGARLTPLDVSFDKGSFGTFPGTGPIPAHDTTLTTNPGFTAPVEASVSQPLSQLHALNLSVGQLGVSRDMSRQDLRTQRQTVVNNVKQQYYTVLQTQSSLEALDEQAAANRELVRVLTEQAGQQAALVSSVLQAKVALAQSEYTLSSTRHTLASQKEQLNVLLARDPATPFRVSAAPATPPAAIDLDAAREAALRQRPDLQKAKLQTSYSDYGVRLGRAAYIPDVSLVVRYIAPVTADQLPKQIAYAGIEISWDIFDWGKKSHALEQSKKALEQAKNAAEDAASQVVLDVNSGFRKLQDAEAFVKVSEANREYARQALREVTDQFRQQAALLKDVLNAQATLGQASTQYQQAVLSYWEARANFDKAVGADQ